MQRKGSMMPRESKGFSILSLKDDFTALDLETTGLDPQADMIIEVGAIKVRGGAEKERYHRLVNPGRPIPWIVTDITGITDDMVEGQPTIEEVLPDFLSWLSDDIILGHNVGFDVNFLYDNSERIIGKPFANDYIDTLRLARYLYPEERHNRLSDLIKRFGIAETQTHRALDDVEQTIACYEFMRRRVSDEGMAMPRNDGRRRGSATIFRGEGNLLHIEPSEMNSDPAFEGQVFVFTGALKRMTRANAQQAVENLGGVNGKTVTKDTNYLVTGSTDYSAALKGAKSSKWLKAERLQSSGQDISIISEDVFYDMLGDSISESQTVAETKEPKPGRGTMWSPSTQPANEKPAGVEVEPHLNADVLHSYDHEEKLREYGRDTWVWITASRGSIPVGVDKGKPTLIVRLDGETVGWLSVKRAEEHAGKLPEDTVVTKGFIKRRKNGLSLLAYFPFD